jgi:hypothetical protein
MEHAHAAPEAAPAVAAPSVVPVASESVVLSMQKTVGNRAVCRAIASGMLARDDAPGAVAAADAAITALTVSPSQSTMPLESGTTITASTTPSNANAKFSLEADTASPAAGTTIDASTGKITLGAKQPGGMMKVKAENSSTETTQAFRLIEKPKEIDSTAEAATGTYEATFTHTFSSSGASTAGLNQANINEKFDSLTAKTPFGGDFTLTANKAGSKGWYLNSSGTMAGPDNVSISSGIDGSKFVKNASNPNPTKLPAGFDMTQKFHFKTLPSGKLEDAPFTTTPHGRHLVDDGGKLKMKLSAGKGKGVLINYAGPPVFRNASAGKPSVEASPPKPTSGTWKQNEVQCSVDVEPSGGAVKWSISSSDKLGCSVDSSGKVKIGSSPGTITVRAGDGTHYDEVTITITAPPPPAGAKPTSEEGAGDAAPAMDAPADQPAGDQAPPPQSAPPQDQGTPPATT